MYSDIIMEIFKTNHVLYAIWDRGLFPSLDAITII